MQSEFQDQVQRSFAKVVARRGFRVLAGGYETKDFGNALVVLEPDGYSLRLVRDRGQVFVEVASPEDPGNWFSLGRVLAAIHGKPDEEETWRGSIDLDEAASAVDEHHGELVEGLGPSRYAQTRLEPNRLGEIAKEKLLRRAERSRAE